MDKDENCVKIRSYQINVHSVEPSHDFFDQICRNGLDLSSPIKQILQEMQNSGSELKYPDVIVMIHPQVGGRLVQFQEKWMLQVVQ